MPRPIDAYGSELASVVVHSSGGRALGPSVLSLVSGLAVRDTTPRDYVADLSGYPRKMLAIISTLDQAVTLALSFSASGQASSLAGQFASGIAVPAGAVRYIGPDGATNASFIADPRLGPGNYVEGLIVGIQAAVAPTTGSISIFVLRNAF